MEQNESIYSLYTRFKDVVNTLGALGKIFLNSENVKKIIRYLLKEWRPKRTVIEEAKNVNTLTIDDLIGLLISYEEDLAAEKGNEDEKKKSMALKASRSESNEENEFEDEDTALMAKKFKMFFKKSSEQRKFRNFKNQKEKKEGNHILQIQKD